MEIEVGEFVRTNNGYITKMTSEDFIKILLEGKSVFGKLLKHSKNIIDLIEVGDYVNGHLVVEISKNAYNQKLVITEVDGKDGAIRHHYLERSIKNVVTHEQFENIEYKVEEEK